MDNEFDDKSYQVLSGHKYERLCADYLRRTGYTEVVVTPGSGDQGIDIVAKKDDISYGIQCKYYSGAVSNKAIQEVYTGIKFYNCDIPVLMTNSTVTKSARELASVTGVKLWENMTYDKITFDREDYQKRIYVSQKQKAAPIDAENMDFIERLIRKKPITIVFFIIIGFLLQIILFIANYFSSYIH